MYKRILVAIDGSEQSYKALDHAIIIAEKFGSELKILTVVPKQQLFVYMPAGVYSHVIPFDTLDTLIPIYTKILAAAEAKVRSEHADVNVTTILMEGQPSVKIVDVAEKEESDIIIMGSRRIRGINGWMMGSTSHGVINSCKKPILIL